MTTKERVAVVNALSYLLNDHVQQNKHRMGVLGADDINKAVKILQRLLEEPKS